MFIIKASEPNLSFADPPAWEVSCESPFLPLEIEVFKISILHEILTNRNWDLRNWTSRINGITIIVIYSENLYIVDCSSIGI